MESDEQRHTYKDIDEMMESPEYIEYVRLIVKGTESGEVAIYPPSLKEEKWKTN